MDHTGCQFDVFVCDIPVKSEKWCQPYPLHAVALQLEVRPVVTQQHPRVAVGDEALVYAAVVDGDGRVTGDAAEAQVLDHASQVSPTVPQSLRHRLDDIVTLLHVARHLYLAARPPSPPPPPRSIHEVTPIRRVRTGSSDSSGGGSLLLLPRPPERTKACAARTTRA
jgi:hypothetical protein